MAKLKDLYFHCDHLVPAKKAREERARSFYERMLEGAAGIFDIAGQRDFECLHLRSHTSELRNYQNLYSQDRSVKEALYNDAYRVALDFGKTLQTMQLIDKSHNLRWTYHQIWTNEDEELPKLKRANEHAR